MTKSTARIHRGTAGNLAFLARRLRAGDVVAVPTETVYGLAANAFDAAACAKIFRAKGRPTTDPLIVHIHALSQLAELCFPNAAALALAEAFWPGPLTLILPKRPNVPELVTAGRSSVAVRMPRHRLLRRLLKLARVPIAAPSANPFGYVSPTTAKHVQEGLGSKIGHILDGGPSAVGLESTIVDIRDPAKPRLLRPGAITRAEIEQVLDRRVPVMRPTRQSGATKQAQLAPGLLLRHYSPKTPVVLHNRLDRFPCADEAYVCVRRPAGQWAKNVRWLDAEGDLRRGARRLFAILRELDAKDYRTLHVELAPGGGLAEAINDRLRRAAAR